MPNSTHRPDHGYCRVGGPLQPNEFLDTVLISDEGASPVRASVHRTSVFGKAPLPDGVFNVSFQRVSVGDSIGYAILANGFWLGTLSGDEGRAFRDYLLSLPRGEVYDALVQVARRMAADLQFGGSADNTTAGAP